MVVAANMPWEAADVQWLSPLAWSGLVVIAVPLLIHLLSRQPPRVDVFPSLRFLKVSPLRPTRRSRISDWLLLLIRCAIVAAAVAALAQPAWNEGRSSTGAGESVSVVLVVDTTTVLPPAGGEPIGAISDTVVLLRSVGELRTALQEAVGVLRTKPAPRALVLRSAFPRFALDSMDMMSLPRDVHVALVSHTARAPGGPRAAARDTIYWVSALDSAATARVVRAVVEVGGDVVLAVRGMPLNASNVTNRFPVVISASQLVVRDLLTSTSAKATAGGDSGVAGALTRLQAVARDEPLRALMRSITDSVSTVPTAANATAVPLQFTANGQVAITGVMRGSRALVISHVDERPNVAVALLLAVSSDAARVAADQSAPLRTTLHDPEILRQWSFVPSASPIGTGNTTDMHTRATLARYLWVLVLALLVAEHFVRSRRHDSAVHETGRSP